ncbi:MAG: hypothetical protein ACKN86_15115, partial [Crocinitomicaceae bacterium]
GWRENSRYRTTTGHASLSYAFNSKFSVTLEYTHMDYLSQQPGGLTDSMFNENHQQSVRARNWFSTPWNSTALHFDYQINETDKLKMSIFHTYAQRNSVGFMKDINLPDSLNGSYFNLRQIDRDWYNNIGAEIRYLKLYKLFAKESALSLGGRFYQGSTIRKQGGIGTVDSDFDLTISQQQTSVNGSFDYKKDQQYGTQNAAFYIENMFQLTKKLSLTPGVRMEYILSSAKGLIDKPVIGVTLSVPNQVRNVVLGGIGA